MSTSLSEAPPGASPSSRAGIQSRQGSLRIHVPMPIGSADWPFVRALQEHWPRATIDCGRIRMGGYRSRLALLAFNWRLAWFAFRSVTAALRRASVDAILVSSDAELIGAALACWLTQQRPRIALLGFIYTDRASQFVSRLRLAMYRRMLGLARCVICFSRLEQRRYQQLFEGTSARFVAIPYGLHVNDRLPPRAPASRYVMSAGRSGRDYAVLARAAQALPLQFKIVCDADAPLRGIEFPENVEVLRDVHGARYFELLKSSEFVVIPLAVDDVSAGQMVLLQAMALGKACVITRTATSQEYGEHGETLLFVEPGSESSMIEAIDQLSADQALRERLGWYALRRYQANHSMAAYARNVATVVDAHCMPDVRP